MSQLQTYDLYFNTITNSDITLIINAPENNELWRKIFKVTSKLIDLIPNRISTIYFAGTGQLCSSEPNDFKVSASGWYKKNKGRVCLVNPILEAAEIGGWIVFITASYPFDLSDWKGHPFQEKMFIINLSESEFNIGFKEFFGQYYLNNIDTIVDHFDDKLINVEIKGSGFAPLKYELVSKGKITTKYGFKEFYINIEPLEEKVELHMKALGIKPPQLKINKSNSGEQIFDAEIENSPWFKSIIWRNIGDLKNAVKAILNNRDYNCPYCHSMHEPDIMRCPSSRRQLLEWKKAIIVQNDEWCFITDYHAHYIEQNRLLFTREGILYLFSNNQWDEYDKIILYKELDNGKWVIYNQAR